MTAHPALDAGQAALDLFGRGLGQPLERGVGLGHKRRDVHRDLPREPPGTGKGQIDDALHVSVLLAGQAEHEIQLELGKSIAVGKLHRTEHVLFRLSLVDRLAHPLGPCLGSDGECLRARFGQRAQQRLRDGIDAHGRHTDPGA